jgi:hypothetical protein
MHGEPEIDRDEAERSVNIRPQVLLQGAAAQHRDNWPEHERRDTEYDPEAGQDTQGTMPQEAQRR